MTESNHKESESIRKEMVKLEDQPKEVVVGPWVRSEEEKPSVRDYKSEDRPASAKTKIDYTEVRSGEENIQEKYKTPDQVLDEDYKAAPTSAEQWQKYIKN
jgi:hypothetical protein